MNDQPSGQPVNSLAARIDRGFAAVFTHLRREGSKGINHATILARVEEDAGWSNRYAFMVLMSAGIAILGLLLSSPAVIIGAMLVSPLMGPIIGLGFAIAVFDWAEVRKSLAALAAGSLLAILFTAAIVWISPLSDRTPEIMARTRPNLFDLLVAIFSALAGGYATVRGRGETIVGVAIATALMPPLAVVGFGLATADLQVFTGAFTLFVTNFVAIALSATIMAKFYGFGAHLSPEQSRAQGWGIFAVFLALAIPLGVSLRQIAWETLVTRAARDTITSTLGDGARIDSLEPDFGARPLAFDAVVVTPAFIPDAAAKITEKLEARIDRPVAIRLQQLVADQDLARALADRSAASPRRAEDVAAGLLRDQLALLAGTGPEEVTLDRESQRALVRIPLESNASLAEIRALEARAATRHPGWDIQLVPPLRRLPPIRFAEDSAELDEFAQDSLGIVGWALARWRLPQVEVEGHSASTEDAGLAQARADAVAKALAGLGIVAAPEAEPGDAGQREAEAEEGRAAFRIAQVEPAD